jgi:hypothetical protein
MNNRIREIETGVPVGRLLTQMVDFCIERIEIVE